jgi:hypothetical protein
MLNDGMLAVGAVESVVVGESCREVRSSSLNDGISALVGSWTGPKASRFPGNERYEVFQREQSPKRH